MKGEILFDDETIRELFGTDTAEDDDPERLKSYFFKNKSYQSIRSNLPLRVLVGHKGIGKSALLKISHLEDLENGVLSITLQPNDLIVDTTHEDNFIRRIDQYKTLIIRRIEQRALEKLSLFDETSKLGAAEASAKRLIHALLETIGQRINVNSNNEAMRLRKSFQKNEIVRVYIDDLDRGWKATADDISNISALINACRDLTNEDRRLQIRIGLRSDAYYLYRTSDESTDKVEGNVIHLSWNRHDILTVMALRVAHFLGKKYDSIEFAARGQAEIAKELYPIIEERFSVGKGHWDRAPIQVVLLSLNRNRPRDLIKLLTQAARVAYKNDHTKISARDLESVFSDYSHGRITDLVLEFKSEVPEIEKLLYNMTPTTAQMRTKDTRWRYTNDELIKKIQSIQQRHHPRFANNRPATAKAIAEFLYKIDFILARSVDPAGRTLWTQFDQNRMLQSQFVDFGYQWEVHPAYRWALNPKSVHEILETIELS